MLFLLGFVISLGLRLPKNSPFHSYGEISIDLHRGWLVWVEALLSGLFLYFFPVFTVGMTLLTFCVGLITHHWVKGKKAEENWDRIIREAVAKAEVKALQFTEEEFKKEIGAMDSLTKGIDYQEGEVMDFGEWCGWILDAYMVEDDGGDQRWVKDGIVYGVATYEGGVKVVYECCLVDRVEVMLNPTIPHIHGAEVMGDGLVKWGDRVWGYEEENGWWVVFNRMKVEGGLYTFDTGEVESPSSYTLIK